MTERKTEIVVGLFVFLAIVVVVLGVIWGKELDFWSQRLHITVRFDDVGGLDPGDPVIVRGMRLGEVEHVTLHSQYVEVGLWLRQDVTLSTHSRVTIGSKELMGGKQVVIHPGEEGKPLQNGDVLVGTALGDLSRLFGDAHAVLQRMDSVFQQIQLSWDSEALLKTVRNMETATGHTAQLISETRYDLHLTLSRLEGMSGQWESDSLALRFSRMVTRLDSTAALMHQVSMRLQDEDGTLGKLLYDRWLYDQMLLTTSRMDSLITDIKSNPKKYIHFSLF